MKAPIYENTTLNTLPVYLLCILVVVYYLLYLNLSIRDVARPMNPPKVNMYIDPKAS
jgi:hypothetical protein